jgi:phage terminase small subunit
MKIVPSSPTSFRGSSRPLEPIAPPSGLSAEAADRWRTLQVEYGIRDAGGLAILRLHCEAFMTVRACEATLAKAGLTNLDRFGQPRAHPAAAILRDARSQMLSTIRALNLDVEAKHPHVGRPLGGR